MAATTDTVRDVFKILVKRRASFCLVDDKVQDRNKCLHDAIKLNDAGLKTLHDFIEIASAFSKKVASNRRLSIWRL